MRLSFARYDLSRQVEKDMFLSQSTATIESTSSLSCMTCCLHTFTKHDAFHLILRMHFSFPAVKGRDMGSGMAGTDRQHRILPF